jgi:hypothetical protein
MIGKPKPVKEKKTRKYRKKTAKQKLDINLNNLVRDIVFLRDKKCVCPPPANGHNSVLQPGHLISRAAKTVKWDLRNVHAQCASCNLTHEHRPEIYTKWFIKSFGLNAYEELVDDSKPGKIYPYEMEELYEELLKIKDKMEENPEWKPYFSQAYIMSGAWRAE